MITLLPKPNVVIGNFNTASVSDLMRLKANSINDDFKYFKYTNSVTTPEKYEIELGKIRQFTYTNGNKINEIDVAVYLSVFFKRPIIFNNGVKFDLVACFAQNSDDTTTRQYHLNKLNLDTIIGITIALDILKIEDANIKTKNELTKILAEWRPTIPYHILVKSGDNVLRLICSRDNILINDDKFVMIYNIIEGWYRMGWYKNKGDERFYNLSFNNQSNSKPTKYIFTGNITSRDVFNMISNNQAVYEDSDIHNIIIYRPFIYLICGLDYKEVLKLMGIQSSDNKEENIHLLCLLSRYSDNLSLDVFQTIPPLRPDMVPSHLEYLGWGNLVFIYYTQIFPPFIKFKPSTFMDRYNSKIVSYMLITNDYSDIRTLDRHISNNTIMYNMIQNLIRYTPQQIINQYSNFMLFPPHVKTDFHKFNYFIANLTSYYSIFQRKTKPIITNFNDYYDIADVLTDFTDYELMQKFPFEGLEWYNRSDLIRRLSILLLNNKPRWVLIKDKTRCINSAEESYFDEVDFNDPNNPVISYGVFKEFRCYNLESLVDAFKPDPNEKAIPRNPIYTGTNITPKGYQDFLETFPLASIMQLEVLLSKSLNKIFEPLLVIIKEIIKNVGEIDIFVTGLKHTINTFTNNEKTLLKEFLFSGFLSCMIARFWKGPGEDWPYKFTEDVRINEEARDKRYLAYSKITQSILEKATPNLQNFIGSDITDFTSPPNHGLKVIKYDWSSDNSTITQDYYYYLLVKSISNEMCLLDIGDRGIRTTYYYLTKLYDMNLDRFNTELESFINKYYLDIRKFLVIEFPFEVYDNNPGTYHKFIPSHVNVTGHVDLTIIPVENIEENLALDFNNA